MSKYKSKGLNIQASNNNVRIHILLPEEVSEKLSFIRTYLEVAVGKKPSKSLVFSLIVDYLYNTIRLSTDLKNGLILEKLFDEINKRPDAI